MEETIRRCDVVVGKGRNRAAHGEVIKDPVRITVGGKNYLMDICPEHEAEMLERLQPYLSIARRAGQALPRNGRGRAVMRAKGGRPFTTADVRIWARENGKDVPATGRVPNELIEEFKEAVGA